MNDRFMIRYWCKDSKEYLHSHKLVYNDGTYTQVSTKQSPNGTYYSYILYDWNTFELIPEQCTGLKDKKDKLIYEGDILNSLYKDDGCRGLYVVVWSNGSLCVKKVGNHQQTFVSISLNDLTRCEVIGNIHENPDLLEQEDVEKD